MKQQAAAASNKRQYARIKTRLLGRYMLADRRESKCIVIDVSLGGVALAAPEKGALGETVVLYIDQIGRVQGKIVRFLDGGFALQLDGSARTTERIAARLRELQAGETLEPHPERRQEARIKLDSDDAPKGVTGGANYEVVDLSFTGADVKLAGERPAIGAVLQVGRLRGTVIRHTSAGVAIEFIDVPETVTLTDRLAEIALTR